METWFHSRRENAANPSAIEPQHSGVSGLGAWGVADQLGHADPAFTLRVYAHAMRDEESDLSFAEFGGSKRLYPALEISGDNSDSSNPLKRLARREGFEPPTLRFEA